MVASPSGQTPLNAMNSSLSTGGGIFSTLNLTAGATVIKAAPGKIMRINVNTVGTAGTFAVYDSATTTVGAASLIASFAATLAAGSMITLEWPCLVGITVVAPTGGVISVSYV